MKFDAPDGKGFLALKIGAGVLIFISMSCKRTDFPFRTIPVPIMNNFVPE